MKMTQSKDGIERATIRLELRLSAKDFADLWIAENIYKISDYDDEAHEIVVKARALLKSQSKAAAMDDIKNMLSSSGLENAIVGAYDNLSLSQIEALEEAGFVNEVAEKLGL